MTNAPKVSFDFPKVIPTSNLNVGKDEEGVIRKLRDQIQSLQFIIDKLTQNTFAAPITGLDGFPQHGQPSSVIQGQWLRLTQAAASPSLHTVNHGLGRRPQGAIFIKTTGFNKTLIGGSASQNIPPASSSVVVFELNGSSGEEHICVLF